jgi:hypothetical protein
LVKSTNYKTLQLVDVDLGYNAICRLHTDKNVSGKLTDPFFRAKNGLVSRFQCSGGTDCPHVQPSRWRQYVPLV